MKKKLIFSLSFALLVVFLVLGFLRFLPDSKNSEVTFLQHSGESDVYAAFSIDKNTQIPATCTQSISSIKTTNSKNESFNLDVISDENQYKIQPLKGGYVEGEVYTILFPNGCTLSHQAETKATQIRFSIARNEVNHVNVKEEVYDLSDILATFKANNYVVIPAETEVKQGDVLIVQDEKTLENRVVKVMSSEVRDQKLVIKYSDVNIEDVFESIDIYQKIEITEKDIVLNEDNLVQWVSESHFLDAFFTKTGALLSPEDIDFKVKLEKNGKIIINVEPKFYNKDKNPLGIKVKITIETLLNPIVDIRSINDLSIFMNANTRFSVSFSPEGEHKFGEFDSIPMDEFYDLYSEQKNDMHFESKSFSLFSIKVPFHPLTEFYADFSIPFKVEGSLMFENNMSYQVNTTAAVVCKSKCDFYSSSKSENSIKDIYLLGQIDAKLGVKIESGVQLAHMAKLGGQIGFGAYVDAKGLLSSKTLFKSEVKGYYEIDLGSYYDTDFVLKQGNKFLNYEYKLSAVKEKTSFMKMSTLEVLSDSNLSNRYYIRDNQLKLSPITLKMYHLIDKKYREIDVKPEDIKLTIGDTELIVNNSMIQLDSSQLNKTHQINLVWSNNGKIHNHSFEVEFIESKIIEKPFPNLEASEIVWVTDNVWSFRKGNRYGLITHEKVLVEPTFDSHFRGSINSICASKRDDYVCFENQDFKNEQWGMGYGIEYWGLFYDTNKKWTYYSDYGMYVRPENDYFRRYVAIQRIVVGSDADKYFSFSGTEKNEFAIAEISKTSSDFTVKLLTPFDYVSVKYTHSSWTFPESNKPALFVAKGKNNKWGIVDTTGKQMVDLVYDQIIDKSKESDNASKTYFTVVKDGKYYVISGVGEVMYEAEDKEVISEMSGTNFWSQRAGKWYLMDLGI